jgi:hypothetical protein
LKKFKAKAAGQSPAAFAVYTRRKMLEQVFVLTVAMW